MILSLSETHPSCWPLRRLEHRSHLLLLQACAALPPPPLPPQHPLLAQQPARPHSCQRRQHRRVQGRLQQPHPAASRHCRARWYWMQHQLCAQVAPALAAAACCLSHLFTRLLLQCQLLLASNAQRLLLQHSHRSPPLHTKTSQCLYTCHLSRLSAAAAPTALQCSLQHTLMRSPTSQQHSTPT